MTLWALRGTARLGGSVLFRADLAVTAGWTCLLGPSGAGKTTLLRVLAGLPVAADFDGTVTRPDRIGWMAQDDLMQPRLTVGQNVALLERLAGRRADPARIASVLARVGLAGFACRRPDTLSGGQRQRVALARCLMQDAPVVALDEPFSALDPDTRRQMQAMARQALAGRAVLMVTHDRAEAELLADRILTLSDGHLTDAPLRAASPAGAG